METNIQIKFSNGNVYEIPATLVADNRAKHYSYQEGKEVYKQEFQYTISDNFILLDWLQNNMNWNDVKDHVTLIGTQELDYSLEFANAESVVVNE